MAWLIIWANGNFLPLAMLTARSTINEANILVLIPARYDSSRFPGKPLATLEIPGNSSEESKKAPSMISFVYSRASEIKKIFGDRHVDVAVVTDDERISKHLEDLGQKVVRVDDVVESGTERIFLAYERYFKSEKKYDFIINVQGDEPLLEGKDLEELVNFHQKSSFDIATIVAEKKDFSEFQNADRVKAVYEKDSGRCHYFSRSPVPHDRDGENLKEWHLHIGVYCYRPEALAKFCQAPVSSLENIEKLEQLRALGLGLGIGATLARHEFIGVDRPEDLKRVEGVLSESTT